MNGLKVFGFIRYQSKTILDLLSFNEVFGDQGRQKWETVVRRDKGKSKSSVHGIM